MNIFFKQQIYMSRALLTKKYTLLHLKSIFFFNSTLIVSRRRFISSKEKLHTGGDIMEVIFK